MKRRRQPPSVKKAQDGDELSVPGPPLLAYGSLFNAVVVIVLALGLTLLHAYHISSMFENDRHFSHLSGLEREMTFRTEMGLYYSYYKTIIHASSFWDGLHQIMHDKVTEFPIEINTLQRFNLYPEALIAALYRIATHYNLVSKQCWRTDRGKDLEPIVSCEGMADEYYFYINHAFALAGTVAGSLFLFGVLLSESILGGILVVAAFFFNHGEATRVQWTPPLRETFAYPFFAVELLAVTYLIKYQLAGLRWIFAIAVLTVLFMLPWQFAQFALCTQVGAILVAYILGYIPSATLRTISLGHLAGFAVAFVLLFGNKMLLTSLFLASLLTLQLIISLEDLVKVIKIKPLIWLVFIALFAAGTIGLKFLIGSALSIEDDAHIFDILRSKFSNYSDFHTRLYTCAAEFDFMQAETPWKLTQTLLLPAAALASLLVVALVVRSELANGVASLLFVTPNQSIKSGGEFVYNLVQALVFGVMAVIIMRLKLFFTPHLCILTSLLCSRCLLHSVVGPRVKAAWQLAAAVALFGMMAIQGIPNIEKQRSIVGEYSNPSQEQLFNWIVKETPPTAVFGGSMPTMANVKLSTQRPIVNHPHYEDAGLRERTMKVYSIFSRKSHAEVFQILQKMRVDYIVFEGGWCNRGNKPGCSMPELWDLSDADNRGNPALCERFNAGDYGPFRLAFSNDAYKVFKIEKPAISFHAKNMPKA